jgi:uncharacterized protein YukE
MADGNISMSHQEMQQAVADIRNRRDELQQYLRQASVTVERVTAKAYRTRTASKEFSAAHKEWNQATGELIGSLDEVAKGVEQAKRIDEETDRQAAEGVRSQVGFGKGAPGRVNGPAPGVGRDEGKYGFGQGAPGISGAPERGLHPEPGLGPEHGIGGDGGHVGFGSGEPGRVGPPERGGDGGQIGFQPGE